MTWYSDLSPCDYFGTSEPHRLLAVGWLTEDKSFPQGQVAPEVLSKIERLAESALHIFVYRGFHICELCGPLANENLVDADRRRVQSSSHLNIFVPCADKIFVAPQCLPHYIAAHGYCPPEEFCKAVLRCPEPGDTALAESLRSTGVPELMDELEYLARSVPSPDTRTP